MSKKFNPITEAIAFRVWQYCRPIGWNCTVVEAAQAVGEPTNRVRAIIGHKDWGIRFRSTRRGDFDSFKPEARG